MASRFAPMSFTPCRSSAPLFARATARFSAVWPPSVGRSASGFSRARICSANSGVMGSMYVRSANPGSVITVAGLEFRRTTS
jgi:hypothetical protein